VSSRDIDSTSENVLHDWAREDRETEAEDADGPENADQGAGTPAWGAATSPPEVEVAEAEPEVEPEPVPEPEPEIAADPTVEPESDPESEPRPDDEAALTVEPSHEHAAGELNLPDGYSVLEGLAEGGRRAVGLVVSRFNGSVTTQLLDGALAELAAAGVRQEAITIMVVPGAFELPLAATALAKTRRFACIVALGCVIRGDTPHFDYVSSEAASGLQLAALETGVPVSFGVLTLDRVEQAESRVGKGAEAVRSALEMADLFAHLRAAASR